MTKGTLRRFSLLWVVLVGGLLTACPGPGAEFGSLRISVSGLPGGVDASVQVVGPNGYVRPLTESEMLTNLPEGTYTVNASPVAVGGTTYTPSVSSESVLVRPGETASVSVVYEADTGPGGGGSISGTVRLVQTVPLEAEAAFVPGEVLVKFRDQQMQPQGRLEVAGRTLETVRALSLGIQLYRAAASEEETLRLIQQLRAREDVLYAHPNYLLEPFAEPDDTLYPDQWHYQAINLPGAWDLTTGSEEVAVAVLDTGVALEHPDLEGKLLPGYDFVSSAQFSGDGDGRDPDPSDPGGESAFHGTHVAGTVAAATDNGVGVAGAGWESRILPVRILGANGGSIMDAIDAILWSAGLEVADMPENPNPAQVLNMSLGGKFFCGSVPGLQEAIDQAVAAGAVVVAAAGNFNEDASKYAPAGCGGVITVGATDLPGERAAYSNFGARLDVMAPGGNMLEDADGNGAPDGVLSTVRDSSGDYDYAYYEGTSMAAPHVAGVVALMKSLAPDLTGPQARDILQETARPILGSGCDVGCGAGLIDAEAALAALGGSVAPEFALSLSPATVSVAPGGSASVEVRISRSEGFDGEVALSVEDVPPGVGASLTPGRTTGNSSTLSLTVGPEVEGTYTLLVQGTAGSRTTTVPLSLVVAEDGGTDLDVSGTYVVACPVTVRDCVIERQPSVQITQGGTSASYEIPDVPAGDYDVIAWKDVNNNNVVDEGEPFGQYAEIVSPPARGIDVTMTPALGTQRGSILKGSP